MFVSSFYKFFNYFSSVNTNEGQISDEAVQTEATPGEPVIVEENGEKVPQGLPSSYKVEKGDTLWSVAEKFYNSGYNWVDIAKENKLKNANVIEVGQELSIPKVAVKKATVLSASDSSKTVVNKIDGDSYQTQKGDFLWDISVRAYGDGYGWVRIYNANEDKIGPNPNILEKGVELSIPRK